MLKMSVFVARADEKQEARPGCCDVDAPCIGGTIADELIHCASAGLAPHVVEFAKTAKKNRRH